nr:probable WRKY transcription factor 62 [Arachis hypogaea]
MANQLLEVLVAHNNKSNNHHYLNRSYDDDKGLMVLLPYAEDLVHQVLRSFTNSLLILNTTTTTKSDAIDHDVFSDGRVVFDSTKFRDFSSTTSSPSLHHTNNNRLRKNYYRCSHKNDQGCPATKKVQQIQDNPPLFRTSYYGHHICKSITYNEETILESESFSESSMFLSFNNNNNNNNNSNVIITPSKEHQFSSSQAFESKNFISQNQLLLSSSDYYHPLCVYEELGFDYSRHHDPMLYSTDEKVQFDNNALGWDLLDYDGLACYGQQI